MFFLSDINLSNYGRKLGSKNRFKKIRRAIWNPDTANAAAVGSGIGWASGRAIDTFGKGHGQLGERIGILGGLVTGTGLAISNKLRNKKYNH